MADMLQTYLFAEVPKRPVLISGEEKATGHPNESTLPEVTNAPVGTFYLRYDGQNILYQKKTVNQTGWGEISGTGSSSDLGALKEQNVIVPREKSFDNIMSNTLQITNDNGEIVTGSIDVISKETGQFLYKGDTQITATIDDSGNIVFNFIPDEPVTVVYGTRENLANLPEDFLTKHFYTNLDEKNIKTLMESMKRLEKDVMIERIKPTGMYTKNTNKGPTITFSYPQDDRIDHFVLERFDEVSKEWVPYDGEEGIIYP